MIILAIDTSCDETSVAVVNDYLILSNVISSQVRYHKKFGGVVPFLAQRLHKERIDSVIELALTRAGLSWPQIEAVAVTVGPGLAPALEVGISKAKELAATHQLSLYAVNHMAGHIASCFAEVGSQKPAISLPAIALLVSGGHTELVYFSRFNQFKILGQTLDDALGEAYDKVAKMAGLGYPGGPMIARLAREGDPLSHSLPIPMQKSGDFNFSFSGLKNAVRLLIYAEKGGTHIHPLTKEQLENIAASFERVAQESIKLKVEKALQHYPEVKSLLLAGGVAANTALRKKMRMSAKKHGIKLFTPITRTLCTDNAAMIGVAAVMGIEAGQQAIPIADLDRQPGLSF